MTVYDRLYKKMDFPPIIVDLLRCPGLLRLRDVRMANNQFFTFPSFSNTSRYEHSLGVCYLAGECAKELDLNERDTIELMIACLYHDVGTPPFAHAMEEVLQSRFGFDHETNLKNLIMGTTGEFDGELAQVFMGESLKLKSISQSKKAVHLGIDLHRIAKIAAGEDEFLSPLINSHGMDLDNIDNVLRASTAMGIPVNDPRSLAITLAKSFLIEDGKIRYNGFYSNEIKEWQRIRDIQYTAIFNSIEDFSYQTMIKKAIELMLEEDDTGATSLDINSWRLSDSSITNNYLLKHPKSKRIMEQVLLCKPYFCLGILYIQGANVSGYLNSHLHKIEAAACEYFTTTLEISKRKLDRKDTPAVLINFFPDKRKRQLDKTAVVWGVERNLDTSPVATEGALLGFFTPFENSNFKHFGTERKNVSFRKKDLMNMGEFLSQDILKNYKITIYGRADNEHFIDEARTNQLGLF